MLFERAAHRIFISYRRSESSVYSELLYKAMASYFGEGNVFIDVEKIIGGDHFADAIDRTLAACDAAVVVIGPQWVTMVDANGHRRLDAPTDLVRHEVATALRLGVRVIPVLVGGASMPQKAELPPALGELADLSALVLTERGVKQDIEDVIEAVQRESFVDLVRRMATLTRLRRWLGAVALVVTIAMLSAAWVSLLDALTLDTRLGSYTMWLGSLLDPAAFSDRLALIAITKETEQRASRPLDKDWRGEHARLLDILAEAGATAVVFDLLMSEQSPYDQKLAAAIRAARRRGTAVILGTAGEIGSAAALQEAATGLGLVCAANRLGYVTAVPLAVEGKPKLLGLALLATTLGTAVEAVDTTARQLYVATPAGLRKVGFSDYDRVSIYQRQCAALQLDDHVAYLIIEFRPLDSVRSPLHRYSYETVLKRADGFSSAWFRGKIVLIGYESDADTFSVFRGLRMERRYGFEVHADAINTLLNNTSIQLLRPVPEFLITICMAAFGVFPRLVPIRPGIRIAIYIFGIVSLYIALGILLYTTSRLLPNAGYHLGAFLLACWISGKVTKRFGLWIPRAT